MWIQTVRDKRNGHLFPTFNIYSKPERTKKERQLLNPDYHAIPSFQMEGKGPKEKKPTSYTVLIKSNLHQ